jgi:glutamyl-tRNA synthetase
VHGEIEPAELSHDERLLVSEAAAIAGDVDWSTEPWRALTDRLKSSTGKKGRELFHPLRFALTGCESGPEMAGLVQRIGKDRVIRRLEAAAKR